MDEFAINPTDVEELVPEPETPEDVAVLYTWANVHGGKYRDFSASRREYRAQQRHRMVEAQRQAELEAARESEEKAARELEAAHQLGIAAGKTALPSAEAEEIRLRAEERAGQERLAAQKHVQTAEDLRLALEEAEREMEEARRRAEEQAARYAEADARWRAQQRGMAEVVPGEINDPYYFAGPLDPGAFAPGKGVRSSMPRRISSERRIVDSYYRARGESNPEGNPRRGDVRRDDEAIGLFEAGGRISSGHRPIYREAASQPPIEHSGNHPETQPRPAADRGERDVDASQDSASGNVPSPDARSRSRESASDVLARTTRRPRANGEAPMAGEYSDYASRSFEADGRNASAYTPSPEPRRQIESDDSVDFRPAGAEPGRPAGVELPRDLAGVSNNAGFEETAPRPARTHYDDRPQTSLLPPQPAREELARREDRPAWLGRDARPSDKDVTPQGFREADEREIEGRRRERDAFEEFLSRTADLTPRSTDDRPARSAYVERDEVRDDRREARADTRPTPDREGLREEEELPIRRNDNLQDDFAERRASVDRLPAIPERGAYREKSGELPVVRSAQRTSPTAAYEIPGVREVPVPRETISPRETGSLPTSEFPFGATSRPDGEIAWPRSERRRFPRSSGSHGIATQLSDSREYRAAARASELEEKIDRSRLQSARREVDLREDSRQDPAGGVYVSGPTAPAGFPASAGMPAPRATDTLQRSQERVAARWFALKGLMGSNTEAVPDALSQARPVTETSAPMLSIVALSGGVGKTSLVATLGRALSSVGERVLLADTTAHGLLPYYFGARELRPDVVRTFSPPPGSIDAPVYMVNYQTDRLATDDAGQVNLVEEIGRHSKGTQRVLLDVNGSSAWLVRRLARLNSAVLVPITPDMNSVLSIQNVERFFGGTQDSEGRPVSPYYVLNQFDASLPLHLDVREVLRQQLGNRLLPVMIRRSQSVSEALAEGMTVIDYAPESAVTEDYIQLAEWVRHLAAPASIGLRRMRWSER